MRPSSPFTSPFNSIPEKNFSGPNPDSPDGAKWSNATCFASDPAIRTTGRLQWQQLDPAIYPTNRTWHNPFPQNVSGLAWGSCSLIDTNIASTAGHCVVPCKYGPKDLGPITPYKPGTTIPLKAFELAPLLAVTFNFELPSCEDADNEIDKIIDISSRTYKVTELLEYRYDKKHKGLDYAFLRLEGQPGKIYGTAKIALVDLHLPTDLAIPQHPMGLPKKVGFGKTTGCLDMACLEVGHRVDTLGGSSGSGSFQEGFLVGIHVAGGMKNNIIVPLLAVFKHSTVLQDIVLKQAGITEEFINSRAKSAKEKDFWVGFVVGGAIGAVLGIGIASSKKKKSSVVIAHGVGGALVGGLMGGVLNTHGKNYKEAARQAGLTKLTQDPKHTGLSM